MDKKVLVLCEYSGIVRDAFNVPGISALSVDLLPTESPGKHIIANAREILYSDTWDCIIAHPPCTFLAKAQMFRTMSSGYYYSETLKAWNFVRCIFNHPCPLIAIENPIGWLNTYWFPPSQITNARNFGSCYIKDICLWLKGLPPLISTCYNYSNKKVRNHVNSRMSKELKNKIKSRFFPEVAQAMYQQWHDIILQ